MNIEKLTTLRNTIAEHRAARKGFETQLYGDVHYVGFNMQCFYNIIPEGQDHVDSCNTAGCIAGWQCLIDGLTPQEINNIDAFDEAKRMLNLTTDQALDLFTPFRRETQFHNRTHGHEESYIPESVASNCWKDITAEQAIAVLDLGIATGVFDWAAVLGFNPVTDVIAQRAARKAELAAIERPTTQDYPNA